LEAEAKKAEEEGAEEVTAEFGAKLSIKGDASGDVATALGKSIGDLVRFLRSGGEVDVILPEEPEEGEEDERRERQELASTLEQVRELEARLRQLEPGSTDESQNEGA
jgi:hypothetical protein